MSTITVNEQSCRDCQQRNGMPPCIELTANQPGRTVIMMVPASSIGPVCPFVATMDEVVSLARNECAAVARGSRESTKTALFQIRGYAGDRKKAIATACHFQETGDRSTYYEHVSLPDGISNVAQRAYSPGMVFLRSYGAGHGNISNEWATYQEWAIRRGLLPDLSKPMAGMRPSRWTVTPGYSGEGSYGPWCLGYGSYQAKRVTTGEDIELRTVQAGGSLSISKFKLGGSGSTSKMTSVGSTAYIGPAASKKQDLDISDFEGTSVIMAGSVGVGAGAQAGVAMFGLPYFCPPFAAMGFARAVVYFGGAQGMAPSAGLSIYSGLVRAQHTLLRKAS